MKKGEITDIDQALGAEPVKEEINNIAEDVISETNNRNIEKNAQIGAELKKK